MDEKNLLDLKLQYSVWGVYTGPWEYCGERTAQFLENCVKYDKRVNSVDEAIALLLEGKELRYGEFVDADMGADNICRSEVPIIAAVEARAKAEAEKFEALKKELTEKACRIYLDVSFAQKDEAKTYGAQWDKTEKRWFYESAEGEYLPYGLMKYQSKKPKARTSSEWLAETGYDWYDQ